MEECGKLLHCNDISNQTKVKICTSVPQEDSQDLYGFQLNKIIRRIKDPEESLLAEPLDFG